MSLDCLRNPLTEQKLIRTLINVCPEISESDLMNQVDPVLNDLAPDMFSDPLARKCFEKILKLRAADKQIDLASVAGDFVYEDEGKIIQQWIGDEDITGLRKSSATIIECYRKRSAYKALETAQEKIISGDDLESIIPDLTETVEKQSSEMLSDEMDSYLIESIFERHISSLGDPSQTGVKTGFYCIDSKIGGLPRNEITILAGRTSEGKSTLALNIADRIASRGGRVAYFSCEDSEKNTFKRWITMTTGVTHAQAEIEWARCKRGEISNVLTDVYNKGSEAAHEKPLYMVFDKSPTVSNIKRFCKKLSMQKGVLSLIVIDYIQILTPEPGNKSEMRYQEIGKMSRMLNILSGELECPILVLAQLGRDSEDRKPTLADLRESGNLEQDADMILFIHRFDEDGNQIPTESGYRFITIAKSKSGARNVDFKIGCDFAKMKITDL